MTAEKAMNVDPFRRPLIWLLAGFLLVLGGCVTTPGQVARHMALDNRPLALEQSSDLSAEPVAYGEISGPAQELVREVAHWLKGDPSMDRVAVTTFVDVNNFNRTSAFGRSMTDALIALLHRQGFQVVELRKTRNFLIEKGKGEFYLSRNIAEIADLQNVSAVLVGTYTEGLNMVIVSTRLISAADGQVLSTGLLELPKSRNLAFLLGGTGLGGYAQVNNLRRAPAIPPSQVPVLERKSKGPAKVKR